MQQGPQEIDRPSMQRDGFDILQGPAEPGRGERQGRRSRQDAHLRRRNLPRQRDADAVEERIARRQHADLAAAQRQHVAHGAVEGRRPRPLLACDDRAGQREMAPAAEHEIGVGDALLGLVAETG